MRTLAYYFGGGTAIALLIDEFRESADIDVLALLTRHGGIPAIAWEKTTEAYGTSVRHAWRRSCEMLDRDPRYFEDCLTKLSVDEGIKPELMQALRDSLRRDESG